MKPVTRSDLIPNAEYLRVRDLYVKDIIAHKERRRVSVGPLVTAVFEDRKTVLFQVQEMVRTENLADAAAVQHEVDTYNALLPRADELSATLLVNVPDRERIREELDRLVGLHDHCALVVGGKRFPAVFDADQFEEKRISAVQYVRFPLGPEGAALFRDPAVPAALVIDHPAYRAEAPLAGAVRASLTGDLKAP